MACPGDEILESFGGTETGRNLSGNVDHNHCKHVKTFEHSVILRRTISTGAGCCPSSVVTILWFGKSQQFTHLNVMSFVRGLLYLTTQDQIDQLAAGFLPPYDTFQVIIHDFQFLPHFVSA